MKYTSFIFVFLLPVMLYSQVAQFDVINAHLNGKFKADTVYLKPSFIQDFSWSKLNPLELEITFKDAWAPLPHPEIPSKDAFMDDLDFERYVQFLKERKVTSVDFDQLSDKIQVADSARVIELRKRRIPIFSVSEPYITTNNKWAIFVVFGELKFVSPFNELLIYRNGDSGWYKYHRIQLSY